jgi:hypothetical protein
VLLSKLRIDGSRPRPWGTILGERHGRYLEPFEAPAYSCGRPIRSSLQALRYSLLDSGWAGVILRQPHRKRFLGLGWDIWLSFATSPVPSVPNVLAILRLFSLLAVTVRPEVVLGLAIAVSTTVLTSWCWSTFGDGWDWCWSIQVGGQREWSLTTLKYSKKFPDSMMRILGHRIKQLRRTWQLYRVNRVFGLRSLPQLATIEMTASGTILLMQSAMHTSSRTRFHLNLGSELWVGRTLVFRDL